jgi:uncharacterized membrane protein
MKDKEKMSKALRREFFERFAALITGAFTFVAALAWNSAIESLIAKYITPGSGISGMFIYAVIVTLIAIVAITQINAIAHTMYKEDKEKESEKTDNK